MNFDLDENQSLFKAAVERFATGADVPARHRTRALPGGFDRARWGELADLGLIALAAPQSDGGLGGSALDCAVVAQALGKSQTVEPWLECGFLAARLLGASQWAADVISGQVLAAFAFAEAGRRYALDAVRMRANKNGTSYRLSGEKQFVLSGAVADLFIVTANLDGATHIFAVPRDAKGVDVKPYPMVDGSIAAILTLRDVTVSAPLPDSAERLAAVLDDARLMAAAEMTGLAQRLFDDTLDYVKTREQFGQPLGRFQVIQHNMVGGYEKIELMQSAIYRAVLDQDADRSRAMVGLKAFVGESAIAVAHLSVQMHGGMGTTDELGIGHGLKRIMLLSKLFGDPASDLAFYAKAA
jgi:alkylation response protein AidB-like acyl-CoA dehydrogenase